MSLLHQLGTMAARQLPPEMAHDATLKSLELGLGPRARSDKAEDGMC
jgi:hypothetical protein